ncbi:hypothetical protein [Glaciimonas sp. PCH181]|uniref:hypothetical protein n=1 Tax=Glaciimonas sp. PCH181 TaxID=2133943 RepID=UPI0011B25DD1|nr:hypothetical protein [Glaciimonas sp. PCH181]
MVRRQSTTSPASRESVTLDAFSTLQANHDQSHSYPIKTAAGREAKAIAFTRHPGKLEATER